MKLNSVMISDILNAPLHTARSKTTGWKILATEQWLRTLSPYTQGPSLNPNPNPYPEILPKPVQGGEFSKLALDYTELVLLDSNPFFQLGIKMGTNHKCPKKTTHYQGSSRSSDVKMRWVRECQITIIFAIMKNKQHGSRHLMQNE